MQPEDLPPDAVLAGIGDGNVHRGRAIVLDLMQRVREAKAALKAEAPAGVTGR
jgi:hypothetical protein